MSTYQSNRPYNSAYTQKDGNANGAIIGGLMGAGAMGGIHAYGQKGLSKLHERQNQKFDELRNTKVRGSGDLTGAVKERSAKLQKISNRSDRIAKASESIEKNLRGGGNWKTRAMAYGGSALAGMAVGAGADAIN